MSAAEWIRDRRALIDAATEGPWGPWTDQDGTPHMRGMLMLGNAAAIIPEGESWIEGVDINPIAHTYTPEDRAFIADSRTSLPKALDALEAVLELHVEGMCSGGYGCEVCEENFPCRTVAAITTALGVES